jgi:hypothetical protein
MTSSKSGISLVALDVTPLARSAPADENSSMRHPENAITPNNAQEMGTGTFQQPLAGDIASSGPSWD